MERKREEEETEVTLTEYQLNGIVNSVQNGAAGFTNFKLEVFLSY
jgi:hypothetical protein